MQYAIQKDGEEIISSLPLSLGADGRLLAFLWWLLLHTLPLLTSKTFGFYYPILKRNSLIKESPP